MAIYKGRILSHNVDVDITGQPHWIAKLQTIEIWDEIEQEWSTTNQTEVEADLILFDQSGNSKFAEQLSLALKWSGCVYSELGNLDLSKVRVQFVVEDGNVTQINKCDAKFTRSRGPFRTKVKPPEPEPEPEPAQTRKVTWANVVEATKAKRESGKITDEQLGKIWAAAVGKFSSNPDDLTGEQWYQVEIDVLKRLKVDLESLEIERFKQEKKLKEVERKKARKQKAWNKSQAKKKMTEKSK